MGSETNVDCVFVREYHLHGNEGKERSRRAKLRKIEREILKKKNPDHENENENVQCNVKSVTNQSLGRHIIILQTTRIFLIITVPYPALILYNFHRKTQRPTQKHSKIP